MLNNKESDVYTKMMFGEKAVRAVGQMIVQAQGDKVVSICGTFIGVPIPQEVHDYYQCEIIIRPIKKISTSEYKGMGLTGAAQQCFDDQMHKS
jgi:hypothetical protein